MMQTLWVNHVWNPIVFGCVACALTVLAACDAVPKHAPLASSGAPLRDPSVVVASQANATLSRLQGSWIVVDAAPRHLTGQATGPRGAQARFMDNTFIMGSERFVLEPLGKGRFLHENGQIWAHWLDEGARTVALGDPSGAWVAILDRTGAPRERLRVAREILDWYGYDVSRFARAGGEQT